MSELTIVIPTYNREKKLLRTLDALIDQLQFHSDVNLIVMDNASDYEVSKIIDTRYDNNPSIHVIRNQSNIGGSANIVKCFEVANSEWMWLLGDDDLPMNNAIATIKDEISKYSDSIYINFASYWQEREHDIIGNGIQSFIEKVDSFDNTLFMSVNVYKTDVFRKEIYYGYTFAYSMAPHYAMKLMAIHNNDLGRFILSNAHIVNWDEADEGHNWSSLRWRTVIRSLLELPLNIDNKTFKKFEKLLPNRSIFGAFVDLTILSMKDPSKFQYYDNALKQLIFRSKDPSFHLVLVYKLMIFLKRNPLLFQFLIKIIFRKSIDQLEKQRKLVQLFNRF